jgi:hypothetical protein
MRVHLLAVLPLLQLWCDEDVAFIREVGSSQEPIHLAPTSSRGELCNACNGELGNLIVRLARLAEEGANTNDGEGPLCISCARRELSEAVTKPAVTLRYGWFPPQELKERLPVSLAAGIAWHALRLASGWA